ncbi:MAG: MFS transporter, partial [Acidimicrobiales bacterium]
GSFAIVPSLLPAEDLQAGNALSSGGTQLATLVGPALGGLVVAVLGSAVAFGVDAASFAISAITLAGVRRVQRIPVSLAGDSDGGTASDLPDRGPTTPQLTLRRLIAAEPVLVLFLAVVVAANLGSGGMSEVALPALAHGPFHAGAGGYGALIAAFGGGALAGTVVAAQVRQARRPAIIASLAFLAEAAFAAAIPYLGGALAAGAALAAFGALNGFGNIIMITAFQRWAPPEVMGRLMGVLLLAGFGIFPISVLLGGLVVHHLGPAAFFPIAGAILAAAIGVGLTQPSWRAFGASDEPDDRRPAHDDFPPASPLTPSVSVGADLAGKTELRDTTL